MRPHQATFFRRSFVGVAFIAVAIVSLPLTLTAQTAITQVVPIDGAVNVSVPATISITFNTAMNSATLTAQSDFGGCSGSIQVSRDNFASCIALPDPPSMSNGNATVTVTPGPALAYGITYKVRVLGTAASAGNVPMGSTFTQMTGFLTATHPSAPAHLMISQVYGGGGNTGAVYTNDFVELHNPMPTPVAIAGMALQYGSATGSTWLVNALPSVMIPAGGYFLVQLGSGGGQGVPLPVPDYIPGSPLQLSSTAGKVALTSDTTVLLNACPISVTIIDLVGYGSANCFEGSGPTGATSNSTGIIRPACSDTDNNVSDFTVTVPNPRNTSSTAVACDGAVNETGSGAEINYCNIQFPSSISAAAGTMSPAIFAQVYQAGYTEFPGASSIDAEIGYGPANINPQNQAGYVWFAAAFNTQAGNNDEYQASFTMPPAGTYRYAARFSLDGVNWTYCDLDGAGSNPNLDFSPAQLGVMTATESAKNRRGQITSVD